MVLIEMNRKGCSDLLLKDCTSNRYSGNHKAPKLTKEDSQKIALALIELVSKNAVDRKRTKPEDHVITMIERGLGHPKDDFFVSNE